MAGNNYACLIIKMDEELFTDTEIQVNCETCSEKDEQPHHMTCYGYGLFECECGNKILLDLEKI